MKTQNPVDPIVDTYLEESAQLVPILQDVQRRLGYLPEFALRHISERLHIPLARLYSVANFYAAFSLEPRGRHEIHVCVGTACHLRGAPKLLDVLKGKFGLEDGKTSPDRRFSLRCVNCLGACALAPVVIVDNEYFDGIGSDKLLKVLKKFK
ncbi:MAG: NADH-quinone oxidoreductase subunit NuoE family protein [Planctomycetota bacterium]|jgi:NADH-quinone oxidoreductase subunit E